MSFMSSFSSERNKTHRVFYPVDGDEEDISPAQLRTLKEKDDKEMAQPKKSSGKVKTDREKKAEQTRKAMAAEKARKKKESKELDVVESVRAVASSDAAAPSGKTIEVKGRTTNVWTCDAATNRHADCVSAKCDECMKSMMAAGASRKAKKRAGAGTKRNRDGVGLVPKKKGGCNHSDPESYNKADNQYIVGDYADKARAEGGKLPTHCVDCGGKFEKARK